MIDFSSSQTEFLFNPRLPENEREMLTAVFAAAGSSQGLPDLRGHIWLASSGTTAGTPALKVVALSKRAFLIAAAAANTHLQSHSHDVWLNPLPLFHVGGLSIYARAFLTGARVFANLGVNGVPKRWSAREFVSICESENVTLASLVPTQVYDLVTERLPAPNSLRAVLVGGGALSPELYTRARELGWPLLPTYGMTETCSQIATAKIDSLSIVNQGRELPPAEILPHIEARVSDDGRLEVRGESLFTEMGYVDKTGYKPMNVVSERWYNTTDHCEILRSDGQRTLKFIARANELIKVGGELVNLAKLREAFARANPALSCVFIGEPDERLGEKVVAVTETATAYSAHLALRKFNETVAPFERVRAIYAIKNLPRTELGKIKIGELSALLPT